MELNSKKLERTSRIVYYSISSLLALFLILLSNKVISDLDSAVRRPEAEDFEDKTTIAKLERDLEGQNAELENLYSRMETIERTVTTARENYSNEKQSFDNWLQARKTLGSPDKDQEVLDRAKGLDNYYKVEEDWRAERDALQVRIDEAEKRQHETQHFIDKELSGANERHAKELEWYELKVFLVRLLFVAPVLALGIFFFIRYRHHKFWPLFFGFTLFSLYAFFFGLVPYLPSYGGYVRYSVGIALSAGIGYYLIRRIREYLEQKQSELKSSSEERARKVQTETAEKALENHFCPSCGKDFLLRRWEFPVKDPVEAEAYKFVTNYCRHCGLELFRKCNQCGNKNFAHLLFCSSCGTKVSAEK